eukprot:746864-Hanusia_phi.AAC.8
MLKTIVRRLEEEQAARSSARLSSFFQKKEEANELKDTSGEVLEPGEPGEEPIAKELSAVQADQTPEEEGAEETAKEDCGGVEDDKSADIQKEGEEGGVPPSDEAEEGNTVNGLRKDESLSESHESQEKSTPSNDDKLMTDVESFKGERTEMSVENASVDEPTSREAGTRNDVDHESATSESSDDETTNFGRLKRVKKRREDHDEATDSHRYMSEVQVTGILHETVLCVVMQFMPGNEEEEENNEQEQEKSEREANSSDSESEPEKVSAS